MRVAKTLSWHATHTHIDVLAAANTFSAQANVFQKYARKKARYEDAAAPAVQRLHRSALVLALPALHLAAKAWNKPRQAALCWNSQHAEQVRARAVSSPALGRS